MHFIQRSRTLLVLMLMSTVISGLLLQTAAAAEVLRRGMSGPEVLQLQQLLNQSVDTQIASAGPGALGQETGFFGDATVEAVKRFQLKHADEVLVPLGHTAPTGIAGARTLALLRQQVPQVQGVSVATTWQSFALLNATGSVSTVESTGVATATQAISKRVPSCRITARPVYLSGSASVSVKLTWTTKNADSAWLTDGGSLLRGEAAQLQNESTLHTIKGTTVDVADSTTFVLVVKNSRTGVEKECSTTVTHTHDAWNEKRAAPTLEVAYIGGAVTATGIVSRDRVVVNPLHCKDGVAYGTIDWGDGMKTELSGSNCTAAHSFSETHTYAKPGTYVVKAIASWSPQVSRTIKVTETNVVSKAPSCTFTITPKTVSTLNPESELTLRWSVRNADSASFAPAWASYLPPAMKSLHDSGKMHLASTTKIKVPPANFEFGLVVKNSVTGETGACSDSVTRVWRSLNTGHATPTIQTTVSEKTLQLTTQVHRPQYTVSSLSPDYCRTDTYFGSIKWGDGASTTLKNTNCSPSASFTESHTYTKPGTYTVSVTDRGRKTVTKQITIFSTATTPSNLPLNTTKCADEAGRCTFTGTKTVWYGANNSYVAKTLTNGTDCRNTVFGDPVPQVRKACYIEIDATATTTVAVLPVSATTPSIRIINQSRESMVAEVRVNNDAPISSCTPTDILDTSAAKVVPATVQLMTESGSVIATYTRSSSRCFPGVATHYLGDVEAALRQYVASNPNVRLTNPTFKLVVTDVAGRTASAPFKLTDVRTQRATVTNVIGTPTVRILARKGREILVDVNVHATGSAAFMNRSYVDGYLTWGGYEESSVSSRTLGLADVVKRPYGLLVRHTFSKTGVYRPTLGLWKHTYDPRTNTTQTERVTVPLGELTVNDSTVVTPYVAGCTFNNVSYRHGQSRTVTINGGSGGTESKTYYCNAGAWSGTNPVGITTSGGTRPENPNGGTWSGSGGTGSTGNTGSAGGTGSSGGSLGSGGNFGGLFGNPF